MVDRPRLRHDVVELPVREFPARRPYQNATDPHRLDRTLVTLRTARGNVFRLGQQGIVRIEMIRHPGTGLPLYHLITYREGTRRRPLLVYDGVEAELGDPDARK